MYIQFHQDSWKNNYLTWCTQEVASTQTLSPLHYTEISSSLISVTYGCGKDTAYHERFKNISTQKLASKELHLLNTYCDLQMRCVAFINYNAKSSVYFQFDFFNVQLMVHKNS